MPHPAGPLFTRAVAESLLAARADGAATWTGSLDLDHSTTTVVLHAGHWSWRDQAQPYPGDLKDRTIYFREGEGYAPAARFSGSLIKLVPTEWGVPTFEIDGIKMLPTAKASPLADAQRKVDLVEPRC